MIKTLAEPSEFHFEWVDVNDPSKEELHEVARRYELHDSSVEDCLQPDHLPKHENVGPYVFIIFRLHAEKVASQADTVQELTDKIAIFMKDNLIITIHRNPWPQSEEINENFVKKGLCKSAHHILNEIVKSGLKTYDARAVELTAEIEYFEENMFLKNRKASLLEGLYYLKRKVDVTRRILLLSNEIIEKTDPKEHSDTYTRDTRDLYVKLHSIYDSLFENTNHLLSIYFSISSQRTNEIIRVLTIFSVFFMPLTFIVGVYGMNFEFMPELKMKFGYPGVMIAMAAITGLIYLWFKRRGWL
ncbi:magnesium transporter CorA family protein [Dyadobacter psychrotolerans]|uniref:Magnesium transporter CorA n=1 Tax=Dyadobacter psychrotolerans TaxID=2541721 RepID=A0A4R5DKZ5_9BACT|nr:CorA family divalent cation transporter [Dyadobacter psychrotolerans]TDE11303.1 magnesium transporter CorA [Dyadobacter psychrotolerans]